jgi:di/tricarboxylate transporter
MLKWLKRNVHMMDWFLVAIPIVIFLAIILWFIAFFYADDPEYQAVPDQAEYAPLIIAYEENNDDSIQK